jgi:hypothetical protein
MKLFIITASLIALCAQQGFGQGAQADQIKRRAKDLSNQNNVRQGATPPSQAPAQPAPLKPTTPGPVTTAQQGIAKIQVGLLILKAASPVTADQKTQFIKDIAVAVRGATKPSLPTVAKFVNDLTTALADVTFESAEKTHTITVKAPTQPDLKMTVEENKKDLTVRLAQNIEAVLNSAAMPVTQFDAIITDAQAILQVGGAKRATAVVVANDLRAIGQEVRRTAR